MLLIGCKSEKLHLPTDMPYSDANTTLPGMELTLVERTDSTTELTFMGLYDQYDSFFRISDDVSLVAEDFQVPLKDVQVIGNTKFEGKNIYLRRGVPSQFKMIFPVIPDDITSIDFIQKEDGKVVNSIWGIDLTGQRSPDEFPAEIPAELLSHDFYSGNLPEIVKGEGIAKVTAHATAWRKWMDPKVEFVVNTIDDTQTRIKAEFDSNGEVTMEFPLEGTACIFAMTPYCTYASFYVDPGEEINLYILPDHHAEAQRFIRPQGVTDGKYRDIPAMGKRLLFFDEDAYVKLVGKKKTNDYFKTMMEIHSNGLDSIKARNFEPDMERYARGRVDRRLMYQALSPDTYTPRDWDERDAAKPDSILRFTPEQVKQIREAIDFSNPMLELGSIGNPGNRSRFLKAKELILAE